MEISQKETTTLEDFSTADHPQKKLAAIENYVYSIEPGKPVITDAKAAKPRLHENEKWMENSNINYKD